MDLHREREFLLLSGRIYEHQLVRFGRQLALASAFALWGRAAMAQTNPGTDKSWNICNQNFVVRTNDTRWRRPRNNDDYIESN
jgi:hypothetical protein